MKLTRLEYAAIKIYAAMVSTLTPPDPPTNACDSQCEPLAERAAAGARVLLAAIDKEQEE
ncbi:MAG: hypothetical protein V3V84_08360 [Candidatus Bathyarchaeia archaeon]